ncbi:PD40 domain-containing protein [candidate division WOR-3 bacterium]|nr:PD40 domain-containing protein [candidate division WOR-3 bacterium]
MNASSTGEKCARGLLLLLLFAVPVALVAAEGDTWIVFDCNRPNPNTTERTYWDIWKLDPDGDGSQSSDSLFGVPLTDDPANEWDPTYSAEDQAVVFVSDVDGWPHLWKVSIDGGYPQGLFLYGQYCTVDPCYSFDGTKIAYASNETGNWDIFMIDADGSNKKRITTNPGDDRSPCFSTDGSKIYFISNRDVPAGGWTQGDWEIYVVDTTGAGTATKAIVDAQSQPLLMDYTEHDPCCSPTDPDIIIFATNVATPTYTDPGLIAEADRINFELFSYNFITRDTNRLTLSWNEYPGSSGPVAQMWNSSMPCFSPDGQRIAWACDNWTSVSWQPLNFPNGPYDPSYWKPDDRGQGSSHQIWVRATNHSPDDHEYWFASSFWGWDTTHDRIGSGDWEGGHQHHKHYNPSWDWLESQE